MNEEDLEILNEFLVESAEILDQLDQEFVELEQDPSSRSRLASIFRGAHTIKGTSGLLGYHKLEAVTHAGENVLARLRDGKLDLTPDITSALLQMVDAIRAILDSIGSSGEEGEATYSALVDQLTAFVSGEAGGGAPKLEAGASRDGAATAEANTTGGETPADPATSSPGGQAEADADASGAPSLAPQGAADATPAAAAPLAVAAGPAPDTPKPPAAAQSAAKPKPKPATASRSADTSVRISVNLLDRLMNLVGELVLARNQVLQCASQTADTNLTTASQRLNLITTELQEGVMQTRMQPISSVWAKFPRIVRDLAMTCGKQVQLEEEGRDTELDRTIIEAIRDPLTHIVRNSVDHGIETPEERTSRGKSASGTLAFRAFHEGGMVNIEVTDDGKGIDAAKVRAKAVERGVISSQAADRMSDREAVALVFQPGFSTAAKVTNVSGRGVGMDVVKTSIEKIGGTVDIQSQVGEGTSIRVKIPLTLAIIPALLVTCRGRRYAIPQINLVEMVRVTPDESDNRIEYVRETPVYRLRGNLLPLVFLGEVLQDQLGEDIAERELNIMVLHTDGRQFGLVVDSVEDTQEIVVKPLGRELKHISAFAGATIMGDGRVALILDVFGIANHVGIAGNGSLEQAYAARGESRSSDSQPLLIVESATKRHFALPLNRVDRLEEVPPSKIEPAGHGRVLQYRGGILPLVFLEEVCGLGRPELSDDTAQVIVISHGKVSFGLIVAYIADIVEQEDLVHDNVRRTGVTGCVVVEGRVTEMLDLASAARLIAASGSAEAA